MASIITFEAGSTTTVTDFNVSGTAGNLVTIDTSVFYPNIEYLVVAGGGGGGTGASINDYAGGGGGGGLIYNASYPITGGTTYTVTVGSGGSAGATDSNGTNGGNSSITTNSASIVALGGGYGATRGANGGAGGSGGGGGTGATYDSVTLAGAATQPASASGGYGNAGGPGFSYNWAIGAGGGGAGSVGEISGGIGLFFASFSAYGESGYFASGGAGVVSGVYTGGAWQLGGGGGFAYNAYWGGSATVPRSAIAATGGGGALGMPGADGTVIMRYPDSYGAATTTGSPTVTVAGGYREYAWTTSGSITFTYTGTQATLSKSSGTVSVDYLSIGNSIATGGATWYAGANSVDVGNNTGWIFTAPPTATATGNFFLFF